MNSPLPFKRHIAIPILLGLGTGFATNHVSARIAFDHGAGLLTAILWRSGMSLICLTLLLLWQRHSLRFERKLWPWQLTLGLLVAFQSFCIFSAVARIPVGIALLVANTFPILLALLNWAVSGKRPSKASVVIMGMILFGLIWVLDAPMWFMNSEQLSSTWFVGLLFAFGAATCFAFILWISENRLANLYGPVRSFYTIGIVFFSMLGLSFTGALEGGTALPVDATGWFALIAVGFFYSCAFIGLFVLTPRLNLSQNAPALNIEPVASLILAWILLEQSLNGRQIFGSAMVVTGIIALASVHRSKRSS